MIFILLIAILVINCVILSYNFVPIVLNVIVNNVVFYLNFVFFLISINQQNKNYGINKSSMTISYAIPFVFILINYIVRHTEVSKPFSDFFGYYFIESDLNYLLNKTKKENDFLFLKPYTYLFSLLGFFSGNNSPGYIESSKSENYEDNWGDFINSIPFNPNGINQNTILNFRNTKELKTIEELDSMTQEKADQYGGSRETILEKILDVFFDFYVKKDTLVVEDILKKSNLFVKKDDIINLLDRKFLISKIIWLILIIIITQGIYTVLVIRD